MTGARSLREWITDSTLLVKARVLIPFLAIVARITLFSGREKIGKSTAVGCFVAAASRGDPVLGTPVAEPVQTLWYSLDEPVADTVRRFVELGANMDSIFINDEPRTESELLLAIAADAKAHRVHLVVVDNLSKVFEAMGLDPNSAHDVGPTMSRLVDFFHREELAAVLLYHTGKIGREYKGSTSIGASVDDVLTLRKRGQSTDEDDFDDDARDDGRRLLVQDGRNLRGRVQLICTEGVYRLYDDALPMRQKILETLRSAGTVDSRTELARLVGGRKQKALETIADLIAYHAITEIGRRLTLSPRGMSELAQAVPENVGVSGTAGTDTPTTTSPASGSQRFPASGTAPELIREPWDDLVEPGSQEEQDLMAKSNAGRAA
jgi:hypothetical protein